MREQRGTTRAESSSANQTRIDRAGRSLARCLVVIRLLRETRHGYALADLAAAVGITVNQIEIDLRISEAAGAIVYRDRGGEPGQPGHRASVVCFGIRFEERSA